MRLTRRNVGSYMRVFTVVFIFTLITRRVKAFTDDTYFTAYFTSVFGKNTETYKIYPF